jgi:hypothetical protein
VAAPAGLPAVQHVAAATASDYADSVDRALQTLRAGPGDDPEVARRAADQLQAGTGDTQSEILDELRASPPNIADARSRLTALSRAVRSPAFTPQPARARSALRDILSQPRYASLSGGPSLADRLSYFLVSLLVWLLERAGGQPFSIAVRAFLGAGALSLLVLLFFLVRAIRGGPRREASQAVAALEEVARDRFAEADRLAALGDFTGAVRSLAEAVAAALGDDRDWELSPLTVREIFGQASDPASLRALLEVFEAAAYGGRPPSPQQYAHAAAAAAEFRPAPGRAAA